MSKRRLARALRDGAAYRIAEAVADGTQPDPSDLQAFRRYRQRHIELTAEMVAAMDEVSR